MLDTIIRGGRVVTSASSFSADLKISGGKVAEVGERLSAEGCEVYDASGCLLFPGFIDAHTHLDMDTGTALTADDFESGTRAALAGGTTALIDFATQDRGSSLADALRIWHAKADGKASCDYGFHMAITDWNDRTAAEIPEMAKAGVTSFKFYLAYDALRISDGALYEALKAVGAVGGIAGVHCENGDLVNELVAGCRAAGQLTPHYHPLSRPDYVEAEAIARYCYIAEAAGVPIHIVHLSCARGLEEARRARARGQKVYLETCPQYLALDDSVYDQAFEESCKFVCSPPLRGLDDQQALWQAIAYGEIDGISTDHCSFYLAQKAMGRDDFSKIPNGMPGLEHRPALIYTKGVAAGRMSENRMAALLSEKIARLFGLFPRKGNLLPGADADVVVWNPQAQWTVRAAEMNQKVDYTPLEGMQMQGRAQAVFLHGQLAAENGKVTQAHLGGYLVREQSRYD